MKPIQIVIYLFVAAIIAASTPATGASRAGAQSARVMTAESVAVSPATEHIFVVSLVYPAGPAMASMLDARTGKVLRTTTLPKAAGWRTIVDDSTHHVFVTVWGSLKPNSQGSVAILDTRTGKLVATVGYGPGPAAEAILLARTSRLLVFTVNTLYAIDTRTGQRVTAMTLKVLDWSHQSWMNSVYVAEGSGCLFFSDSRGSVKVYDMRTWKVVATARIPGPVLPGIYVAPAFAWVSGKNWDSLNMLDTHTGRIKWSIHVPNMSGRIAAPVVDSSTGHAFAISFGAHLGPKGGVINTKSTVTTVNLKTHAIVRSVTLPGTAAQKAGVDAVTHHLFVLALKGLNNRGDPVGNHAMLSMLDARTGALLHTTSIPLTDYTNAMVVVDRSHSRVYVTMNVHPSDTGHNLTVVDARTGDLLPSVQ